MPSAKKKKKVSIAITPPNFFLCIPFGCTTRIYLMVSFSKLKREREREHKIDQILKYSLLNSQQLMIYYFSLLYAKTYPAK